MVSRQRLLVFSEALICLSYSGEWPAGPQPNRRRLVVPRGNAPRSLAYRASALLLSYRTWRKASVMLRPPWKRIRFSGPAQPACICLPSVKWSGWQELHLRPPRSEQGRLLLTLHPGTGCQTWTRTKTSGLTGRRATLTLPGNGAAGRISTCIVPLRRRMPHVFDHGSN